MRKASEVSIPDRVLSLKEFQSLRQKAFNSAKWQAAKYRRSSAEIERRLRDKGFGYEGVVYKDSDGKEVFCDIPTDVIEDLVRSGILDDDMFAEELFESMVRSGKSMRHIKNKLLSKGFQDETVKKIILRADDIDYQNLEVQAEKTIRSSKFFKAENSYQRKQVIYSRLLNMGFNIEDIDFWLEKNPQSLTKDN